MLRGPYDAALERRFEAWRIKYVLVTNPRPSLGSTSSSASAAGSEHPGWPATATLRLVADAGTAKLFERVRGARIGGHAPAGATITVDAPVPTATTTLRYRASATAGSDGRFARRRPVRRRRAGASRRSGRRARRRASTADARCRASSPTSSPTASVAVAPSRLAGGLRRRCAAPGAVRRADAGDARRGAAGLVAGRAAAAAAAVGRAAGAPPAAADARRPRASADASARSRRRPRPRRAGA